MLAKGRASDIETRGVSHPGFIDSIYFRDPDGYVIELSCKREGHDAAMDPRDNAIYCWGHNDRAQLGRGYVGSYDWTPRPSAPAKS